MLITHDRGFMDRVVTHTLGIHRQKTRKIAGDTSKYYTQIAQDEEIFEKTRLNDERRTKEIEQFITRFRAKARLAGLVQSRVKALAKLEKKQKLEQMRDLDFSFRDQPFRGKQTVAVRDLSFAYPHRRPLFKDLDFVLHAGERMCVVGPNGKGKTTLLQLLSGRLAPASGDIVFHPGVVSGFYEQTNIQVLNDRYTVEEEVLHSHPDLDRQRARNICGAMMFDGDNALKKIEVLSGGEKARVMLGKLLATPLNLLLLDEPSNHLDMESCDALLAAIDAFDGAVIMVTHNEMFLHALAQRLVVFQQDSVTLFDGTYQEFLEKGGWGDEPGLQLSRSASEATLSEDSKRNKKELRRLRSTVVGENAKLRKPVETAIAETEAFIESEERRLAQLNAEMVSAAQSKEGGRIQQFSQDIRQCQKNIDERFASLEALYSQKESLDAQLAAKLAELGDA
jgi:ATP-binding cassette subfamily F protein 3